MAIGGSAMCLGLVLVALLHAGAMAQLDCTSAIYVMAPCLNFITGNSPNPSSSCCSRLSSVVKIQPRCLCSVLNGGGISLAFNINQTQALALPGACNVQTPSVSQCNFSNGSATSPTASPKDVPADSPAEKTPSTTPASKIPPGAMDQSACTNVIVVMAPCMTFINGNSSSPSSSCCSQLASVVKSHPICLCSVLNRGASPIPINQTQALALPGACNVQTPPASQCNAANGPAISPTASPKDVPADSPAGKTPTTANTLAISPNIPADPATENTPTSSIPATPSNNIPSGNGSETTPNTGEAADGIVTKVSLHLRVSLLFVVACASTF